MASSGPRFEDMSRKQLLDTAGLLAADRREAELAELELAYQWAVANGPDTLDPERAGRPGAERAVRYGGAGTPRVAEFCAATLGARLGRSAYAGQALVADAVDLRHRLPQLWARVVAGEAFAGHARLVARRTRELSVQEAACVDGRVAEYADGRISWSRFEALVEAAIKAADPDAAARREEQARRAQWARTDRQASHGMLGFSVRTHAHWVLQLNATVGHLADALEALGQAGTKDELRAMAMVVLANPAEACRLLAEHHARRASRPTDQEAPARDDDPAAPEADPEHPDAPDQPAATGGPEGIVADALDLLRDTGQAIPAGARPVLDWDKLLPRTTLHVHLYGGRLAGDASRVTHVTGLDRADAPGIARVEGIGAVTEAWVRDVLGPRSRLTVRPVLDLEGQAPVDAWEVPERHRQAVLIMSPADAFPYASTSVNDTGGRSRLQVDHTRAWKQGGEGQSRIGNYAPLSLRHHRIKTHGHWQVAQPFPGILLWRDEQGTVYLVDHTGTRRVEHHDDDAA